MTLLSLRTSRGRRGPASPLSAPRRTPGFTLLELLTVMGLIGVLMVLLVPALSNFGKANELTAAGNQIVGLANQARQNSISRGALTMLIIANEGSGSHRAAALYELRPRPDGSALQAVDWKPVTRWMTLPTGILVDPHSPSTKLADQNSLLAPPLPPLAIANQALARYQMVIFKSDGGLYPVGNIAVPRLRLTEGILEAGNTVRYQRGGSGINFYDILFLPANGRLKIERS